MQQYGEDDFNPSVFPNLELEANEELILFRCSALDKTLHVVLEAVQILRHRSLNVAVVLPLL